MSMQSQVLEILTKHDYLIKLDAFTDREHKLCVRYPACVDTRIADVQFHKYEIYYPNTICLTIHSDMELIAQDIFNLPIYVIRPYLFVDITLACTLLRYHQDYICATLNGEQCTASEAIQSIKYPLMMIDDINIETELMCVLRQALASNFKDIDTTQFRPEVSSAYKILQQSFYTEYSQ